MKDNRSPKDLRREPEIRRTSKKMFGSQYRIEVSAAILKLPTMWTTADLEAALADPDLPWSCVAKELATLRDLGLVVRAQPESIGGRVPYRRGDPSEFWELIDAMGRRPQPLRVVQFDRLGDIS
jgi:predicted transcriptional regulator